MSDEHLTSDEFRKRAAEVLDVNQLVHDLIGALEAREAENEKLRAVIDAWEEEGEEARAEKAELQFRLMQAEERVEELRSEDSS